MSRPNEQVRAKVRRYFLTHPDSWEESDNFVSRQTGVSIPTVISVRLNLVWHGQLKPPPDNKHAPDRRKNGAVSRGGYRFLPDGRTVRESEYTTELRRLLREKRGEGNVIADE